MPFSGKAPPTNSVWVGWKRGMKVGECGLFWILRRVVRGWCVLKLTVTVKDSQASYYRLNYSFYVKILVVRQFSKTFIDVEALYIWSNPFCSFVKPWRWIETLHITTIRGFFPFNEFWNFQSNVDVELTWNNEIWSSIDKQHIPTIIIYCQSRWSTSSTSDDVAKHPAQLFINPNV